MRSGLHDCMAVSVRAILGEAIRAWRLIIVWSECASNTSKDTTTSFIDYALHICVVFVLLYIFIVDQVCIRQLGWVVLEAMSDISWITPKQPHTSRKHKEYDQGENTTINGIHNGE